MKSSLRMVFSSRNDFVSYRKNSKNSIELSSNDDGKKTRNPLRFEEDRPIQA